MRTLALVIAAILSGAPSDGGRAHSPDLVRFCGVRPPRESAIATLPMPSRPVALLVFDARIDTKGITHDVRVVRSSGDPDWDRSVVAVFRRRRYTPAMRFGEPIEVVATIAVRVDFRKGDCDRIRVGSCAPDVE